MRLRIVHFCFVVFPLSEVALVVSRKAYSPLQRDDGQCMVRPEPDETKTKLELPLSKHKTKDKQVEISHATIYNHTSFPWLLFPAEVGLSFIFPSKP